MVLDSLTIPASQKERARAALARHGYSEDDFDWVSTEEGPRTLYVTYNTTGLRQMYDLADWVSHFEEDLKNQVFKGLGSDE
ncbi:MAG TPA: hypothetical protein VNO70_08205 [Blastocatellia bacterium]|nr:hypothetical protein [Blastocatellia bacterium]